ncbi:thioester-forming surface-anchored protein, partial [Streptococcus pyogenes]|uniref:thioester-forming surface-anchored protein n=1 Tax=Streptococcus pyogenes TaxID=1314 RepID=UPI0037DA20C9
RKINDTKKIAIKLKLPVIPNRIYFRFIMVFYRMSGVSVGHAETEMEQTNKEHFEIKKNKSQEEYNYEVYDNRNILQDGEHKLENKKELMGTGKTYQGFCFQLTKNFPTAQGVSKKLYKK